MAPENACRGARGQNFRAEAPQTVGFAGLFWATKATKVRTKWQQPKNLYGACWKPNVRKQLQKTLALTEKAVALGPVVNSGDTELISPADYWIVSSIWSYEVWRLFSCWPSSFWNTGGWISWMGLQVPGPFAHNHCVLCRWLMLFCDVLWWCGCTFHIKCSMFQVPRMENLKRCH